ncbi:MAG: class I adenylate-forming enzyme family protein, partial [Candidatus Methylomirabilales bacterium]
ALVVGERRVSYAELDELAGRMANVLRLSGVERGDRVVILADSSVLAVSAIFASLKVGAVFSPINPSTKADKLAYVLNNCRAKAVITPAGLLPVASDAIDRAASVVATLVDDLPPGAAVKGGLSLREAMPAAPPDDLANAGIDIDLAMLIYTSGSTGFPKGVMMTHQNVVAAAISITTYVENTGDDIILSALPLSFDYGLYQVLMAAKVGATVVLEKSFAYPAAVLQKMRREQATGFPLVPTMAALLLRMKELEPGSFPHLRYITNTAAALPPAHIARLQELFPTTRIYSMYGLTECKRCTYLPPEQLATRPGSVGKAIPNTEVYLVNDRGERVGPGETGELVIRGGHVMKGYWEDPEATDRALRPSDNPWEKVLYSGDLFRTDQEGYLYFVGRKDDIIKSRGEKVSPKEIENTLYALHGVREAAVIGVPDPILGMAIKAVIAPTEPGALTERDVLAHCARHLEDFMVPKAVEFVSELPKTDSGKIRRSQVQAEALGGHGH